MQATGPGVWGNNVSIAVANGTAAASFRIDISDGANVVEVYDNIPDATPGQALNRVNGTSARVRLSFIPAGAAAARPNNAAATPLAGGVDSNMAGGADGAAITPGDFSGDPAATPDQRTGFAGLELIDEVNMLIAPDEVNGTIANNDQITTELVNQCERLRDRFAILSIPAGSGDVQALRPPRDSSYGAVYYPWIRIFDARLQDTLLVPPAGHVAGIYARSDIERGVHKAPANEVVQGMVYRDINGVRRPLEYDIGRGGPGHPQSARRERDPRLPRRRPQHPGLGARAPCRAIRCGATSTYGGCSFISRSRSTRERSGSSSSRTMSRPGRASGRASAIFLLTVWRNGALRGLTQDEAFFVRCDRTTMTEAEIDAGMLICEIGIAPVKPAEFVIFRIQQKTLEQTA